MKEDKMREKIEKVLKQNRELSLVEKGNRDVLLALIMEVVAPVAGKGNLGATVMTRDASMHDGKHKGSGPRPQSL